MTDRIDRAKYAEMRHRDHALAECLAKAEEPEQLINNGLVLCIDCFAPVSAQRLNAKPNAARCIRCQQAVETQNGIYR